MDLWTQVTLVITVIVLVCVAWYGGYNHGCAVTHSKQLAAERKRWEEQQ